MTTMKIPSDVLEFAKYVQHQAAIPYLNYMTEETNVLAYQMNTNIVLSHTLLTHSNDTIKTVVAHEIAHRSVMPATRLEQNTHSAIAKLEGIPQNKAHDFLNIIYDLIVDRNNLWQEWSDTYIAGLKEARAYSYISNPIDENTVFNNICLSIQNEYDMAQLTLNSIEQNVFDLLYTDTRPFTKRLRELARIFKDLFSNSSSTEHPCGKPEQSCGGGNNNSNSNGNSGDLPFDDKISANDAEKIAAKLSEIFDDVHPGRLNKLDLKIQSEFRRRRALKIALPLLRSTNVSKDSRQHVGTWSAEHSTHELDLKQTIQRSGVMIPGRTTQRVAPVKSTSNNMPARKPHVVLLVDTSGSMTGQKLERLVDATIALNRTAKNKHWPVSLITFDWDAKLLYKKTYDHSAVEITLSELRAGGGTDIGAAIRSATQFGTNISTFIFTDESNDSLTDAPQIKTLTKLKSSGDVFLYCIGEVLTSQQKRSLRNSITKAYSIPENMNYSSVIIADALVL